MHSRVGNIYDQTTDFIAAIGTWIWDTTELIVDIILEFIGRSVELAFAVLYIICQVIGFLRDMCIEALQTFGNVIRGIINVVGSIDVEDIEDFASACIVVLLWIIAAKCILAAFDKVSDSIFMILSLEILKLL